MIISDMKYVKSMDDVMQTKIDVASMQQLRKSADGHLKHVLDHVDEQTQYMSDNVRQQISLKEFLDKHHYSATQTY